jgi:hypothetical protein
MAAPGRVGGGGLAPWTPSKLYEQAIPASVRDAWRERMRSSASELVVAAGDATPEQLAEFEAFAGEDARPGRDEHEPGSTSAAPVRCKFAR